MNNNGYICRLCQQTSLFKVLTFNNAPKNVQRLFSKADVHVDKPVDFDVFECRSCGFVQIPPLLDDDYYDDYMMVSTHSQQIQDYQKRQSTDFINRFDLQGVKVLEIGCGDGSYLDHLKKAGCDPTGIEPSATSRLIALGRGHTVLDGYITRKRVLDGGPYCGFVTRQVLEHVPDIHDFLAGINANLEVGAVGLVEVPSLEKALQDRRYYDFFPDHVNYFSSRTLRIALELNGFEVVDVVHDMFDEYITATVMRCSFFA